MEEQTVVFLTLEERTALELGINSEQSESDVSLEEALEFARTRRKEWMRKTGSE